MRRFVSIALLLCFALMSASASSGIGFSELNDDRDLRNEIAISAVSDPLDGSSVRDATLDNQTDLLDDDCPCKKETAATKIVCGVTLAFSNNAATLDSPPLSKARFALSKSSIPKSFIDHLKRPPRTIL